MATRVVRIWLPCGLALVLLALVAPVDASAATSPFAGATVSSQGLTCVAQPDGVRLCEGGDGASSVPPGPDLRVKSFDGVPLDVNVMLPPVQAGEPDGHYPLVIQLHSWAEQKGGLTSEQYFGPTADEWARDGYAVLQPTARGWGDSCGTVQSRAIDPADCATGFTRLDDTRYEIRDPQYLTGLLVDEGLVDVARIGATGDAYGGSAVLAIATLRDRYMDIDGSLKAWRSPRGVPLHLAAAAPMIPASDLIYALVPNGRTLDYTITSRGDDWAPVGVEKQSFVSGLYALGTAEAYYAPPGVASDADLTSWYAEINAGEPYDGNPAISALVQEIAHYHSSYYLLDGSFGTTREAPAPLLIANGFTDDLFPVDEALRFYNRERSSYRSDPISLMFGDFGHQRGTGKPADLALLVANVRAWFDHYVKGGAPDPGRYVEALTDTCPHSAPSAGPFLASTWQALHPGVVAYASAGTQQDVQTIDSAGGDPTVSQAIDPVAGGGDSCATTPAGDESGAATYRLPPAAGSGYTLLGAPAVTATMSVTGTFPEVAARLWDVDPAANTQTLVARGIYRPGADGRQVFELHPAAWRFAPGHVPKLELLGRDAPYARASNGQFSIAVSGISLRLPTRDAPGSAGGQVGRP